jgi:predicted RNA-binding Zn-ribbon protein involved in translation (DUF1610 family)
MGILADFREVLKGLKHKKRGIATTNFCPKCGSPKILLTSGLGTYPRMYGITPEEFMCPECGYKGPIVLEKPREETKEEAD